MTEHTHTDKTLQGNDKIESAIAALQHEPSQEMLAHVLTVIRRRMNEHGELIIAVDPSSAASGLQVQAIQTDDGRKWWAAFTSFDEELKGSGSVMSTFLTDMKQLFNSAITADNIQGIIINPWNRTIMLDKALLRIILGEISSYNHQFNWWFIISPPKGCPTARPKGRISQALLLARYKAVPLESSFLDSSACSLIYFWTASSVIFPIVST